MFKNIFFALVLISSSTFADELDSFTAMKYKADFIIFHNDETAEIIDTKGFKTKEYIAKKKVFEDKYNLKIKEE